MFTRWIPSLVGFSHSRGRCWPAPSRERGFFLVDIQRRAVLRIMIHPLAGKPTYKDKAYAVTKKSNGERNEKEALMFYPVQIPELKAGEKPISTLVILNFIDPDGSWPRRR